MKERLDILVANRNLAPSREKAKVMIKEGSVMVNGKIETKPGNDFDVESEITIVGDVLLYVSRGGLKLEKAINVFDIVLKNAVCMDIGASTGGFTDCMLKAGAKKVYSVDVGHDQLHDKLRNDERVVVLEDTNIKYLTKETVIDDVVFASIDVSFISLTKILVPVRELLADNAYLVCLIKPQFEAGKKNIGKNGVVKDKKVHFKVIEEVLDFAITAGFDIYGLDYSPIKGPQGNIEYLAYLKKSGHFVGEWHCNNNILEIVDASHKQL